MIVHNLQLRHQADQPSVLATGYKDGGCATCPELIRALHTGYHKTLLEHLPRTPWAALACCRLPKMVVLAGAAIGRSQLLLLQQLLLPECADRSCTG